MRVGGGHVMGGRWLCQGQEGWETGSGVKCEEREGSEGARLRGQLYSYDG